MSSRRDVLVTIAAATAVSPAQHEGHAPAARIPAPRSDWKKKQPRFFSTEEMAMLSALSDTILPRTDTPGASDAGVPLVIDSNAASNPALQTRWREGLALLEKETQRLHQTGFSAASAEIRNKVVDDFSRARRSDKSSFFQLAKSATIDAYYVTYEGLHLELGWNANTYLSEFKGVGQPLPEFPLAARPARKAARKERG
jgi:hypothetical protein